MLPFNSSKKRILFQTQITLRELESIPFLSGLIYAKVKLPKFSYFTKKYEIVNHTVHLNEKISFDSSFTAKNDGFLQPIILRISFRREVLGGKSFDKLGYVNIDLAQYVSSLYPSQQYLIQNQNSRSFNSILRVLIIMRQTSGDSCYKVQQNKSLLDPKLIDDCTINSYGISPNLTGKNSQIPNAKVMPIYSKDSKVFDEDETATINPHCVQIKDLMENILLYNCYSSLSYPNTCNLYEYFLKDDENGINDLIRNKRLSTIDHPSERIFSSRIRAENVVDQLVNKGSLDNQRNPNHCEKKSALILDNNGLPTLTNTDSFENL